MDFRMDFSSLQKMLNELKPKYVLASSAYAKPMARRPDLQIHYEKIWPIEYDESVQISKLSRNKRKFLTVEVHPDVVKSMQFKQHPTKKLAVASVACHLSAYNDEFKLLPTKSKIARRKFGKINVEKLVKALRAKNLQVEEVRKPGNHRNDENEEEKKASLAKIDSILCIKELGVKITVKSDGTGTKITAQKSESREKVLEIIKSLLVEDDGIVGRKN